ncbi:MAG: hypothetical protein WBR21_02065 [Rouxiella badensis]|uniref:hypothetical protein n=1 Tax=Rouxiella badensis TaxID=1646377 RepID=UPI003C68F46B
MEQQAIDVTRETNPSSLLRWLPGGSKFLLAAGGCLLVALFYLLAFFPRHHSWEVAAFILVGLSVFAGLHHATSIPHAVPLFVDDMIHVVLGASAVQLAIRSGGMTAVQAAALVGALAWLSSRIGLLDKRVLPASVYCGAFAGMTSSYVLPGTPWIILAGICTGVIYSWAKHFWVGIGGKLGTIAFAGTALTVLVARLAGWNHAPPASSPVDGPLLWAVFAVGVVAAPLTFVLAEPCNFGAVCASAVPSAVLALGINLLSAPWQMKMTPIATAWFGASFAGMTSMERLAGRYWMLPLLGLIFAFLFVGSGPRVHGFGGLLGTTALVSVLAGLGLARWWPTNAITPAKHA